MYLYIFSIPLKPQYKHLQIIKASICFILLFSGFDLKVEYTTNTQIFNNKFDFMFNF